MKKGTLEGAFLTHRSTNQSTSFTWWLTTETWNIKTNMMALVAI